jgi:hypothetical protein
VDTRLSYIVHEDHPNRDRYRDRYRQYKKFTVGCGVELFDFDFDTDFDIDTYLDIGYWVLDIGY